MINGPAARRPLGEFAQSVLAVRWLALAALIALEAVESPRTSLGVALPLYIGILVYALGLTLTAWAVPHRADAATRWAIPFDLAAVLVGMLFTPHGRAFFSLGVVVCVMTGLVLSRRGTLLAVAALAAAQIPNLPSSLFAPDRYLSWGIAALALLSVSWAAAGVAAGAQSNAESTRTVAEMDAAASAGSPQ
ncbi:MAG: hypothetical protein ACRDF6_13340, partial [bacterium]